MNKKCNYLSAQHSHDKVCFNFVCVYREHKQRGTNTTKLEKMEILKNGKEGSEGHQNESTRQRNQTRKTSHKKNYLSRSVVRQHRLIEHL